MKLHNDTPGLTLPLPAFVLHPLTAVGIAVLHIYLSAEHLSKLFSGPIQGTDIWKGFGALGGLTCSPRWHLAALPEARIKTFGCIRIRRG